MKIDRKFRDAIPPLSEEERTLLEESVCRDGCREPFVVWKEKDILLDGHHRKGICDRHELRYPRIIKLAFETREEAADWIDANQLGRRNLSADAKTILLARRYARTKKAPHRPTKGGQNVHLTPEKTAETIAKQHGVNEKTVRRAEKQVELLDRAKADDPDIEKKVMRGDVKLSDVVREQKRAELVEKLEDTAAVAVKKARGVYDTIVIDPPWPMQKIERDVAPNQVGLDYPIMNEAELAALSVPCAKDCHVWLWTTHKFLPMAFRLLDEWAFKYVCTFVWHKPGGFQPFNLPQYNCEFALYARKGTPEFLSTKLLPTCFNAPRGEHSEKPEDFYDTVRRITAGRRLDMFNRREIVGFDGWGQEAK